MLSAGAYLLFYERQQPRQVVAVAPAEDRWVGRMREAVRPGQASMQVPWLQQGLCCGICAT